MATGQLPPRWAQWLASVSPQRTSEVSGRRHVGEGAHGSHRPSDTESDLDWVFAVDSMVVHAHQPAAGGPSKETRTASRAAMPSDARRADCQSPPTIGFFMTLLRRRMMEGQQESVRYAGRCGIADRPVLALGGRLASNGGGPARWCGQARAGCPVRCALLRPGPIPASVGSWPRSMTRSYEPRSTGSS